MKKIIFLPLSLIVGVIGLNIALAIGLGLTYHNLTQEKPIAILTFEKVPNNNQVFLANLYIEDRQENNQSEIKKMNYEIYGNQWRIDAIFVKMKYLANVFGIDSKYVLDRLEGRYKNIKDENSKKHFAYKIEEHKLIDILDPLVDTTYGSSVYKDIEPNVKYIVLKTPTGLMVREERENEKGSSLIKEGKKYLEDVGDKVNGVIKSIFKN